MGKMGRPISREPYTKASINVSERLYWLFIAEVIERRMTQRALMEMLLEERYQV